MIFKLHWFGWRVHGASVGVCFFTTQETSRFCRNSCNSLLSNNHKHKNNNLLTLFKRLGRVHVLTFPPAQNEMTHQQIQWKTTAKRYIIKIRDHALRLHVVCNVFVSARFLYKFYRPDSCFDNKRSMTIAIISIRKEPNTNWYRFNWTRKKMKWRRGEKKTHIIFGEISVFFSRLERSISQRWLSHTLLIYIATSCENFMQTVRTHCFTLKKMWF